ncbi:MAG: carboxypeptidase regulatory-like domain-containing protein [Bacteroidales bacterium]|nr:carboxypeptidase regulatory-like domain-containing protein [Bacteroidales bacterium]
MRVYYRIFMLLSILYFGNNNLSFGSTSNINNAIPLASLVSGHVHSNGGLPLNGVVVHAGSVSAMTNDTGYYSMQLDPGSYNLNFSKTGYTSLVMNITVISGTPVVVDTVLFELTNAPACATASVSFNDSLSTAHWCPPVGPYELLYDDGSAESYPANQEAGDMNAVRFTPGGYPATITGAKFFIGNVPGGNCLGTTMIVKVYSSSASGLPFHLLDSVQVMIVQLGWLQVTGLNATINSGDFFIAMEQHATPLHCPSLGIDNSAPTSYKSYINTALTGSEWMLANYQDFMIRAIVYGPIPVLNDKKATSRLIQNGNAINISDENIESDGSRKQAVSHQAEDKEDVPLSVFRYAFYRIWCPDTIQPVSAGVYTLISNVLSATEYVEAGASWTALPEGWYAYGIVADYPGVGVSDMTYTNRVAHKMYADITVNVQNQCQQAPAEGAIVRLTAQNYPFQTMTDTIPASGSLTIGHIVAGLYNIKISYPGCTSYTEALTLYSSRTIDVSLRQVANPVRNLFVSDQSLVATWDEPLSVLIDQHFENGNFPPAGWQSNSMGMGWYISNNGDSSSWNINPHTSYAVANDHSAGTSNNGCCDYLITPQLDLTAAPSYVLSFASFFDGSAGQTAYVEMSTDGGVSWTIIHTCTPHAGWFQEDVDLTPYSGPLAAYSTVLLAFHTADNGNVGSGWAIDDIVLASGGLPVLSYSVYLDSSLVSVVPQDVLMWQFDPNYMNQGQSYTACVQANYCYISTNWECDDFSNYFLYPPQNLNVTDSVTATFGSAIVDWQAPDSNNCILEGYNIYRNGENIASLSDTITIYRDLNLVPGNYCYYITAIYELSCIGMPGIIGESMMAGPGCTEIVYGADLPFSEDFSSGQFGTALWTAGQNWVVDSQTDNPVPAARFVWEPLLENYFSGLESFWMNTTELDSLAPYLVWFDFDAKLDDPTLSGTEKLTVEVWDGNLWNTVLEYVNNGSFDWTTNHLDITSFASDRVFKVRFTANGISSVGIHYWSVDNIHIYTTTALIPPLSLTTDLVDPLGDAIMLNWQAPVAGSPEKKAGITPTPSISNLEISSSSVLTGYNIYRRDVSKSNSVNDTLNEYVLIASSDTTMYIDDNLSNYPVSCYQYYVTAVYELGESDSSNTDTECLYTSIKQFESKNIRIYPNPAKDFLNIEIPEKARNFRVYNAIGTIMADIALKNESIYCLRTGEFLPGLYTLVIEASEGKLLNCKFIIEQ